MKKTILMFAAAGLMLATPSCKKGENDPGLSLSSRTSRIAGVWNLTGLSMNSRNDESDGDYQTTTQMLAGNVITSTVTNHDASTGVSVTTKSTITLDKAEITIEKDGTWSQIWNTTTVTTNMYTDFLGDEHTETVTSVGTNNTSGNWSFLGKVKEGTETFKNKERVVLNILSSSSTSSSTTVDQNTTDGTSTTTDNGSTSGTNTYSSGESQTTYEIDQLKGKEMIWKTSEAQSGTFSATNGGTTVTAADDDYTSDGSWTWTIVK